MSFTTTDSRVFRLRRIAKARNYEEGEKPGIAGPVVKGRGTAEEALCCFFASSTSQHSRALSLSRVYTSLSLSLALLLERASGALRCCCSLLVGLVGWLVGAACKESLCVCGTCVFLVCTRVGRSGGCLRGPKRARTRTHTRTSHSRVARPLVGWISTT